jgi:hypothetical protein
MLYLHFLSLITRVLMYKKEKSPPQIHHIPAVDEATMKTLEPVFEREKAKKVPYWGQPIETVGSCPIKLRDSMATTPRTKAIIWFCVR